MSLPTVLFVFQYFDIPDPSLFPLVGIKPIQLGTGGEENVLIFLPCLQVHRLGELDHGLKVDVWAFFYCVIVTVGSVVTGLGGRGAEYGRSCATPAERFGIWGDIKKAFTW